MAHRYRATVTVEVDSVVTDATVGCVDRVCGPRKITEVAHFGSDGTDRADIYKAARRAVNGTIRSMGLDSPEAN